MTRARVALAISAYRSDEAVLRLVEQALGVPDPPWSGVLVVDSLQSGAIPEAIARRGWAGRVDYHASETNLGSAGNLALRLELAAQGDFEWAYAINHDGVVDASVVRSLVAFASGQERLGAVYPLRRLTTRGAEYDLSGLDRLPLVARTSRRAPPGPTPVHWGSSNGALYSLRPIREGTAVWSDLWMGWEDLAFGWRLEAAGYQQVLLPEVVVDDNYEYRTHQGAGLRVPVTAKPSWYTYYFARNLILAARRTGQRLPTSSMVATRIALELGTIVAFRPQKLTRARLLARGAWHGLLGVTGKGVVP